MKTVFSNDMTAHAWAEQNQEHGRNPKNSMSFRGPILYSYSTPIGLFVQGTKGRKAVLQTTRSYSMTTEGKHKHAMRNAIRGRSDVVSFSVPFGRGDEYQLLNKSAKIRRKQHAEYLKGMLTGYRDQLGTFTRARNLYYSNQHQLANYLADSINSIARYAEFFGLRMPAMDSNADAARIWAVRTEREARTSTPEHQERLRKARERKAERKAKLAEEERLKFIDDNENAFLTWMMATDDLWHRKPYPTSFPLEHPIRCYMEQNEREAKRKTNADWLASFVTWREGNGPLPARNHDALSTLSVFDREAFDDALHAQAIREQAESIAEWRSGKRVYVSFYDVPTMLRLNSERTEVETSRGASVPLADALNLLPFVMACHAGQREINHSILKTGQRVGLFRLERIAPNGDVTIGCHEIQFSETLAFVQVLRDAGIALPESVTAYADTLNGVATVTE